ncbi:hypothetical protein [Flavobacterium mekongense]|uniref:hypothetical protein n=1 Tax=Flavobacterium mekongense TaxID=3379707 RepID=UPI00399B8EE2
MKSKLITVLLGMSLLLISCKNDEKKQEQTVEDPNKELFKVTLDLVIKHNDTLHLYYTEDNSINFTEEASIWQAVPGNPNAQQMTFILPKDVFPTQFRIDFGVNNKENEEIVLNGIKFNYLDKSFAAMGDNIFMYFRPDENATNLDRANRILKRKNPSEKKGASLYPHETVLGPEILKLAK